MCEGEEWKEDEHLLSYWELKRQIDSLIATFSSIYPLFFKIVAADFMTQNITTILPAEENHKLPLTTLHLTIADQRMAQENQGI